MHANQTDHSKLERWERIEGIIYDMSPPPTSDHQRIVGNLFSSIHTYLKGKTCKVFVAPFGVWLDEEENGNYVEPDITIICNSSKIQEKGCLGVPDVVMEVISPSTGKKDRTVKLRRYRISGVKECWLVDPMNLTVEVYQFADNVFTEPQVYDKEDRIRISIFGDLEIDLHDVFV